ncbi:MAG TPA: ester cyclase [Nocardioidaceae bacterium]|nr:ester cyclase [Nocardioidaceae bacterium]
MDPRQLAENYVRIWNADAPRELVDQIFLADFVDHNPQPGQEKDGVAGIHQVLDVYHAGFPSLRVTPDEVIVSGDRAVVRWTAVGAHEGDLLGIQATHRDVRMTGIDILRIADGLIVERWGETNALQTMQQIGAI